MILHPILSAVSLSRESRTSPPAALFYTPGLGLPGICGPAGRLGLGRAATSTSSVRVYDAGALTEQLEGCPATTPGSRFTLL
eukprot:scaffold2935_cov104-Isochrysis_galbana.AAC.7